MLLNCPNPNPLTARRLNQSILEEINQNIHWKDWCWSWTSNTLATWWEEPTHWKRPWCWKRLRGGGEGRVTENEVIGWHHQLNGHEFEQTPGDSEGQGSLACWSPRGCKESDMTYELNSNKKEGEFIINQFGYFIYTQWQFAESLPETSPIRRP